MIKKIGVLFVCLSFIILTAGCQSNKSRAVEGALIGGLLGATAGGIIGHQSGHGGEGAGIGVAAGALTGALVGSQIEKKQPASASGASSTQMSIQQVVDLSRQGANEDVIVDKIRLTNSKFTLSATDIAYLQEQGVSQKVINAMQGI